LAQSCAKVEDAPAMTMVIAAAGVVLVAVHIVLLLTGQARRRNAGRE
jgi:hypothetical protein